MAMRASNVAPHRLMVAVPVQVASHLNQTSLLICVGAPNPQPDGSSGPSVDAPCVVKLFEPTCATVALVQTLLTGGGKPVMFTSSINQSSRLFCVDRLRK